MAAGQASANAAIDQLVYEFSTLVLHAVNLLEPGMIIVGSDDEPLRDLVMERLLQRVEERRLSYGPGRTQIVASNLGQYGVVRGAVVPTLQSVFRMPRWT